MLNIIEYFRRNILIGRDYSWLLKYLEENELTINTIANFGCGDGNETLALMYILNANEAVGIDKNDGYIVDFIYCYFGL